MTILCLLARPAAIRDNYLDQKQCGGVHTLTPRQNRRIRKAKNRAEGVK